MSSDYRPRGAGSSGNSRRRRGGRSRSPQDYNSGRFDSGEARPRTNGSDASAKSNPISRFFKWILGKKKDDHGTATRAARPSTPRENKVREPRVERPRREEATPKAEPILLEITTTKLYIGNLSYEAAEKDLFDLFSKVGAVKSVEIAMDRRLNRSKGFGFVEMEELDSAKQAAEKYNRTEFMGRPILVSGAKLDRRLNSAGVEGESRPEAEDQSAPPL